MVQVYCFLPFSNTSMFISLLLFFQPCGVDYELKTFVADGVDEKPHKR